MPRKPPVASINAHNMIRWAGVYAYVLQRVCEEEIGDGYGGNRAAVASIGAGGYGTVGGLTWLRYCSGGGHRVVALHS